MFNSPSASYNLMSALMSVQPMNVPMGNVFYMDYVGPRSKKAKRIDREKMFNKVSTKYPITNNMWKIDRGHYRNTFDGRGIDHEDTFVLTDAWDRKFNNEWVFKREKRKLFLTNITTVDGMSVVFKIRL